AALQSVLVMKQDDLMNLQTKTSRFNQLRQQGLIGDADREGWVEQLAASKQRLGLAALGLSYTLKTPQAVAVAAPDAPTPTDAGLQTHDLEFELNNSHEEDLLTFLNDYRTHVKGFFRVEACSLGSPTDTGLKARCTLRFFSVPDSKPSQVAS
ncbi:MAG: hypothetical protein PHH58_13730, partial [Rhodoferax sp.]|nr:hypothetical protein [Rhodoferax sp.]